MNLTNIIAQLRDHLESVNASILAMERLEEQKGRPKSLAAKRDKLTRVQVKRAGAGAS